MKRCAEPNVFIRHHWVIDATGGKDDTTMDERKSPAKKSNVRRVQRVVSNVENIFIIGIFFWFKTNNLI